MERRWQEWQEICDRRAKLTESASEVMTDQARQQLAEVFRDGRDGEFWLHVKDEIEGQIRSAESRFLDTLAPSYEDYVQLWAKRHALIGVLAIPE